MKNLRRLTAPATEPVSLVEAKAYLHVTHDEEDAFITRLIKSARQTCEDYTRRAFISQTWRLTASSWQECRDETGLLILDRSPLASVQFVKYYPSGGGAQLTLDASGYNVVSGILPGGVTLSYNSSWPGLTSRVDAVAIDFTAGDADAATFALNWEPLKDAMLYLISQRFINRVPEVQGTIVSKVENSLDWLLKSYRISGFVS